MLLLLLAACAATPFGALAELAGLLAGPSSAAAAEADGFGDAACLLQADLGKVSRSRRSRPPSGGGGPPQLVSDSLRAALEAGADAMMGRFHRLVSDGTFVRSLPPEALLGCGNSTFHELGMAIPEWQRLHPGVDGFCHFANFAFWFAGAGGIADYRLYGREGASGWVTASRALCGFLGENGGPARRIEFRRGAMQWAHLDACMDAVDDPYCYSLGWLKGQRLDDANMSDVAAWRAKGKSECRRIQETYNFIDEEVTVGRHVFGTPVYMAKSLNAILGRGPPVAHRMYSEHAYTKCQLGDALGEMAYCYSRGCVLADGTIAHGSACGYDP